MEEQLMLAKTSPQNPIREFVYRTDKEGNPTGQGVVIAEGRMNTVANMGTLISGAKELHPEFHTIPLENDPRRHKQVMERFSHFFKL